MPNEVLMDVFVNLAYSGGGFVLGYLAAHEAKFRIPKLNLRQRPRNRDEHP
jgi:hypothetical protein